MTANKRAIERIEELRLSDAQERGIAALLAECMSADYEGRSYFQNRAHCRFIVEDGGTIIGHLGISYRAIRMGDELVDIVGIGEVAVTENHRHQGIGGQLLDAALEEGRTARADFAALFGEKSLYAGTGFVHAPNRLTASEMGGVRTGDIVREPNSYFMVKRLGEREWDADVPIDLAGFPF